MSFDSIVQIDYDYLLVGNHVDETTQGKIIRGECQFWETTPKRQDFSRRGRQDGINCKEWENILDSSY